MRSDAIRCMISANSFTSLPAADLLSTDAKKHRPMVRFDVPPSGPQAICSFIKTLSGNIGCSQAFLPPRPRQEPNPTPPPAHIGRGHARGVNQVNPTAPAFSLLVYTRQPLPTRLFLKKSRTSLNPTVQSRSENALKCLRESRLIRSPGRVCAVAEPKRNRTSIPVSLTKDGWADSDSECNKSIVSFFF